MPCSWSTMSPRVTTWAPVKASKAWHWATSPGPMPPSTRMWRGLGLGGLAGAPDVGVGVPRRSRPPVAAVLVRTVPAVRRRRLPHRHHAAARDRPHPPAPQHHRAFDHRLGPAGNALVPTSTRSHCGGGIQKWPAICVGREKTRCASDRSSGAARSGRRSPPTAAGSCCPAFTDRPIAVRSKLAPACAGPTGSPWPPPARTCPYCGGHALSCRWVPSTDVPERRLPPGGVLVGRK